MKPKKKARQISLAQPLGNICRTAEREPLGRLKPHQHAVLKTILAASGIAGRGLPAAE